MSTNQRAANVANQHVRGDNLPPRTHGLMWSMLLITLCLLGHSAQAANPARLTQPKSGGPDTSDGSTQTGDGGFGTTTEPALCVAPGARSTYGSNSGVKIEIPSATEVESQGLTYETFDTSYDGPAGYEWTSDQWPYITSPVASKVFVYLGHDVNGDFDTSTGQALHFSANYVLTHDAVGHAYTITSVKGAVPRKWTFYDYDTSNVSINRAGMLKESIDAAGNVTSSTIDASGRITKLEKSVSSGGTTTLFTRTYEYYSSGASVDKLQFAKLEFKVGAGSLTNVRQIEYLYYDGTTKYGALNDLQEARVYDVNSGTFTSTPVSRELYRYYKGLSASAITRSSSTATVTVSGHGYSNGDTVTIVGADQAEYNGAFVIANKTTNTFDITVAGSPASPGTGSSIQVVNGRGFPHGLKFVVGADAYRRTLAAGLTALETQTDATVAGYADKYYEYGIDRRITKEVTSANCGGCSGGGGFTAGNTYAYTTSANSDGYNSWKLKTIKTQPDGNTLTTYTNYADQVMLTVFDETGASPARRWYRFFQYNARGQQILEAESSAITGYDETKADLLNSVSGNYQYLSDSSGLIRVTDYYSSTNVGTGAVDGYVSEVKLKHGETATAVSLRKYEYTSHADSVGLTVYPLAKSIVYPDASGTSTTIETSRSYDWYTNSNKPSTVATTRPSVATAQNGPGGSGAEEVVVLDELRNPVWKKDARGSITRRKYDAATGYAARGLATEIINDVDTSSISDSGIYAVPSGWSTAGTFGRHLQNAVSYDDRGRQTEWLGATRAAEISGSSVSIRDALWTAYANNGTLDVVQTSRGYPGSGTLIAVGPARVQESEDGKIRRQLTRVISTVTAVDSSGTIESSAGKEMDALGRVTIEGFASSNATKVFNVQNTDVKQYDSMGRLTRDVDVGDTVTYRDYDARGNLIRVASALDVSATPATVTEYEYDGGNAAGDGNLTKVTQYVDGSTTRVTTYGYDWRNRRVSVDGEVDRYEVMTYDNLDRVTRVDRYDTTSGGNLIGRTDTKYDDLGRVYQTISYAVDPASGTVGNSLVGNNWYDAGGNVIKSISPGAGKLHTKRTYDGSGRNTINYVGYDASETSYADVGSISGDTIVSQTENTCDEAGNLTLVTMRDRLHDATGTGALSTISGSQPKARVSYRAMWYDGGGRQVGSADYGTNADSSLTRPSVTPSRSDTVLVTTSTYDDAGLVSVLKDPAGEEMHKFYDAAGRATKTVEAWNDGSFTTGSKDQDRTTEYTFNPYGGVTQITARNAATGDQVTAYGYAISGFCIDRRHPCVVVYPDSDDTAVAGNGTDGVYDRVETTYDRQGELLTRKDQNGSVHTYNYDGLGRLLHDRVTTFGSGVEDTVKRVSKAYEVRGMLASVTSYNNATVGSGTILNQSSMEYNSFGQLTKEYQANVSAVNTSTSLNTQYSYADGSSSSNQIRKTKVTYPGGRDVFYLYADAGDTSGVSDQLNRVTAIATASTRGTSDVNVIASYLFNGMGQLIRKDYPTPQVRLDYWGGTSGTFAGLDRFGRTTSQDWVDYSGTARDVFKINHGYDRDGNRLYADNDVYTGASHVYSYDNLNRLTDDQHGLINSSNSGIETAWDAGNHTWALDATGNQSAVGEDGAGTFTTNTANAANEYTTHTAKGNVAKAPMGDEFTTNTAANWAKPGSGDAFDINTTNSGQLTITTIAQDTIDSVTEPAAQGIVLLGTDIGPAQQEINLTFPTGTTTGQAGIVFGYKSGADYWIKVADMVGAVNVYHVVSGTKTLISSDSHKVYPDVALTLGLEARRTSLPQDGYTYLSDGWPSGRVGLFTSVANVKFDYSRIYPDARLRDIAGRWTATSTASVNSSGRLQLASATADATRPVFAKGLARSKYQVTFAVRREASATLADVGLAFGGRDQDDYYEVRFQHSNTLTSPSGVRHLDLAPNYALTGTASNLPALTSSSVLWLRATVDTASGITVKAATSEAGLSSASDCYSATAYAPGLFGFVCTSGTCSIDDVTVKSYNTSTSAYDITELVEPFTLDGSGYASDTLVYDKAGNMTYDGLQQYAYDAWNRLRTVAHAYRDSSSVLHAGQVFVMHSYDGKGRRITKDVREAGGLGDGVWRWYYDNDSVIEVRDGSFQPAKQYVWGTRYVDELVQVMSQMILGLDPMDLDPDYIITGETTYHYDSSGARGSAYTGIYTIGKPMWACQDANYNVLGVINGDGVLRERYTYTPYGERQAFRSAGAADVGDFSPLFASEREAFGSDPYNNFPMAYGVCDVGHQGLIHDEESGLVYNRARMLCPGPGMGRFNRRDPREFDDDQNMYLYLISSPITRRDASGECVCCFKLNIGKLTIGSSCAPFIGRIRIMPEDGTPLAPPPGPNNTIDADGIVIKNPPDASPIYSNWKIHGSTCVTVACVPAQPPSEFKLVFTTCTNILGALSGESQPPTLQGPDYFGPCPGPRCANGW